MFQSTEQVQVTIDDAAPPVFELCVEGIDGARVDFDRSDPFTEAVADGAYELALARTQVRLPQGAIRVVVLEDEHGCKPPADRVARLVARRLVH